MGTPFPRSVGMWGFTGWEGGSIPKDFPLPALGVILPLRGSQRSPPAEAPNLWSWGLAWDQGKPSVFRLSASQGTPLCPPQQMGDPKPPLPIC